MTLSGTTPFGRADTIGELEGECWKDCLKTALVLETSRERKKLAPNCPSAKLVSANARAIVNFPVPARPFSQKMHCSRSPVNHRSTSRRTSFPVPLRHPLPVPAAAPGVCDVIRPVEKGEVCRLPPIGQFTQSEGWGMRLTMSWQLLL